MSQINPFVHAVFQNIQVQRHAVVEKERQLRREQTVAKDIAAEDDVLEHQVESTEEVLPLQDDDHKPPRRPRHKRPGVANLTDDEDDESHIDLTA